MINVAKLDKKPESIHVEYAKPYTIIFGLPLEIFVIHELMRMGIVVLDRAPVTPKQKRTKKKELPPKSAQIFERVVILK